MVLYFNVNLDTYRQMMRVFGLARHLVRESESAQRSLVFRLQTRSLSNFHAIAQVSWSTLAVPA